MFLPNQDKHASLEKISEVDEWEEMSTPRSNSMTKSRLSRPQTNKTPAQRSQAAILRGSSVKRENKEHSSRMNKELDAERLENTNVLLTELDEEAYINTREENENDNERQPRGSSSSSDDDDDNEEDLNYDLNDDDDIFMVNYRRKRWQRRRRRRAAAVKKQLNLNDIENPKDYETDLEAHTDDRKLVLKYHQFSDDEIRAISKPLWNNFNVEQLYLDGNWIVYNGVKYISRMIRKNDFITELSLADNRLGESLECTSEICRMLSENCVLKKLNLSGNGFGDKDAEMIIAALEKNRVLKQLDLSHNHLGDESGKLLYHYISSNDTLSVLNLSWNNFRNRAAREIANGLKENVRLKRFDVSYNGFDMESGKLLADVIRLNNTIETLNIASTRLNAQCAAAIANAFEHNDSLKVLNISNNPLTTSGALAIIYAVKLNSSCILENLDLSEVPVTKDFNVVLKEIIDVKPKFVCKHGPIISTSNTKSILYDGGGKVDFEKIIDALKNNKSTN